MIAGIYGRHRPSMRSRLRMSALGSLVLAILLLAGAEGAVSDRIFTSTESWAVDELCGKLGLTTPAKTDACSVTAIFENLAEAYQPLACKADPGVSGGLRKPPAWDKHAYGTMLPQDLPDIRSYHQGTPQNLPFMPFMKAEGATYYWYYRNLLNLANWASCAAVANGTSRASAHVHLPVPEGWVLEDVIDLPTSPNNTQGRFNGSLPYAVLLKPHPHSRHARHASCMRWFSKSSQARQVAKQKHLLVGQQDQVAASVMAAAISDKNDVSSAAIMTDPTAMSASAMSEEPFSAPVTPAHRLRKMRAAQQARMAAQQKVQVLAQQYAQQAAEDSDLAATYRQEEKGARQSTRVQTASTEPQGTAQSVPESGQQYTVTESEPSSSSSSDEAVAELQQAADSAQEAPQATTTSDSAVQAELSFLGQELSAPVRGQYGQGQRQYGQQQKQYNQQYGQQYNQGSEQYNQHQKQYSQGPEYSQRLGESYHRSYYGAGQQEPYPQRGSYEKQPVPSYDPTAYQKNKYPGYDRPSYPSYEIQGQPKPYPQPKPDPQPQPYPQPQQGDYDNGAFYLYGSGSADKDSYSEKPYSPTEQPDDYLPGLDQWKHSNAPYQPQYSEQKGEYAPYHKDTYSGYESQEQPNPYPQPQQGDYDGGAFYRYGNGGADKDSYYKEQYKRPDTYEKQYDPDQHYSAGSAPSYPPMDGHYGHQEPHPQFDAHYEHPQYRPMPHEQYNTGGPEAPYGEYEKPRYSQDPKSVSDIAYGEYPRGPPSDHNMQYGEEEPQPSYGPKDLSDIPYRTASGKNYTQHEEETEPEPDSGYDGPESEYGDSEPEKRYPERYPEPDMGYGRHQQQPHKHFKTPYHQPDESELPNHMPPKEPYGSKQYKQYTPDSRYKMPYEGKQYNPPKQYTPDGLYEDKKYNPYTRQYEDKQYNLQYKAQDSPKKQYEGKQYEAKQYNPQDSPNKQYTPPKQYTPDGLYEPDEVPYTGKPYTPQYEDKQYNVQDSPEKQYEGKQYNPQYEGKQYNPQPRDHRGQDYGPGDQGYGPGHEANYGPGYAEPELDESLLEEFDVMYNWEDMRYDEHYSCGDGEHEGAAPSLVVLIRDSLTPAEWGLGLTYDQVDSVAYGPGKVLAGAWYAADEVWKGGLGDVIEREVGEGCRAFTVAGASFGGAVAQLLAMRIEEEIAKYDMAVDPTNKAGATPAPVTVVTFGARNVGDREWASAFNKKVNARNIAFQGDLFTKFPCEDRVGTQGRSEPATTDNFQYTRPAGNIVYPGAAMPFTAKYQMTQSWSALTHFSGQQLCRDDFIGAATAVRTCSYLCMTSQFVGESSNMCWLDPNRSPAYGSTRCNWAGGSPVIVTPVRQDRAMPVSA